MDQTTGLPHEDLVTSELIWTVKTGKINSFDCSMFNLNLPEEGIFVALEWLIVEENKFK